MIREAALSDAKAIAEIYNYYILNTIITFEEKILTENEMAERIANVLKIYTWLVYEEDGKILGYAYANKWRERSAYRFTAESTVYIKNDCIGKSIGTKLYFELISFLKEKSVHAVIGGLALPNERSQALHEKFGFKKSAHLNEVGYKFDQWIDVGYWELLL